MSSGHAVVAGVRAAPMTMPCVLWNLEPEHRLLDALFGRQCDAERDRVAREVAWSIGSP